MIAEVTARLAEFVAIPSVSGSEGRLADRIAEICEEAGVPARREGRNVIAQRGDGPPHLLLNSHLDTVSPSDGWSADPWKPRHEAGRLVGLGANDAKASVVSLLEAFLTAPIPSRGALIYAATCDEETGGEGLERVAPGLAFDAAIVGEPNDFAIAVSQKGLVKLRLTALGRAGHAARPRLSENAIVRAAEDVLAIETMAFSVEDPLLGMPTAAVTVVRGGERSNVIPGRCELVVDARTIPGFDNARMIETIRQTVTSEVEVISSRLRPVAGDPDWAIARAAQAARPDRPVTGFPSVSDLAHLSGSPAIVFGPGTPDQSHRADESIALDALREAPETYRRTIAAYFGLEEAAG